MSIGKHPNGSKILFNKKGHKYTDSKGLYTSVTTLVSKYFPKFNKEKVSKNYAKKHGISQKKVLKAWKRKGDRTRDRGNRGHFYADNFLKGKKYKVLSKDKKLYELISNTLTKLSKMYTQISTETIIFSPKSRIAGTVDLFMQDSDCNLVIFDWKFNEKIETENPWENCLKPLQHLQATKFNKYTLQMNLYKRILEYEMYTTSDVKMFILHVPSDAECFLVEIPDLQEEVKLICST